MRIVETKVYQFEELSETAQEKAVEAMADINVDYDWWTQDGLLDLSAQEMKDRRIKLSEEWWNSDKPTDRNGNIIGEYPAHTGLINYEIAAFSIDRDYFVQYKDIKIRCDNTFRKFLRIPKRLYENCWTTFENPSRGYYNDSTVFSIEADFWDSREFTAKQQSIVDRAIEIVNDKIAESLAMLQSEYESLTSREAIVETIKINEYEFSANGKF